MRLKRPLRTSLKMTVYSRWHKRVMAVTLEEEINKQLMDGLKRLREEMITVLIDA